MALSPVAETPEPALNGRVRNPLGPCEVQGGLALRHLRRPAGDVRILGDTLGQARRRRDGGNGLQRALRAVEGRGATAPRSRPDAPSPHRARWVRSRAMRLVRQPWALVSSTGDTLPALTRSAAVRSTCSARRTSSRFRRRRCWALSTSTKACVTWVRTSMRVAS